MQKLKSGYNQKHNLTTEINKYIKVRISYFLLQCPPMARNQRSTFVFSHKPCRKHVVPKCSNQFLHGKIVICDMKFLHETSFTRFSIHARSVEAEKLIYYFVNDVWCEIIQSTNNRLFMAGDIFSLISTIRYKSQGKDTASKRDIVRTA